MSVDMRLSEMLPSAVFLALQHTGISTYPKTDCYCGGCRAGKTLADYLESEKATLLIHRTVAGTNISLPIYFTAYIEALESEIGRLNAKLSAPISEITRAVAPQNQISPENPQFGASGDPE